ncbi:hypothetical protein ILYODFUR_023300 [Ilyodon furcidens]|uniref:Uncharacterized protein n=1 Tax=Ilyodon furcidens TaxID=33524 RepID=A0ABV0TMW9_9TELE
MSDALHNPGLYRRVARRKLQLEECPKEVRLLLATSHVEDMTTVVRRASGQMRPKSKVLANTMCSGYPTLHFTLNTSSPLLTRWWQHHAVGMRYFSRWEDG